MKLIIISIILILIYLCQNHHATRSFFTTERVHSAIDGNTYPVVKLYDDRQEAANKIATMNLFATNLITQLKSKYLTIAPVTPEQIKGFSIATILDKRYSAGALSENKPKTDKDTSYTQNKGEIIALCLREKQTGKNKFHSDNVIKFVLLHELAHIVTPELNHSILFWNNFRFLLEFCKKYKLYTAPNFNTNNEHYCGMTITYNPIYDNKRTTTYF